MDSTTLWIVLCCAPFAGGIIVSSLIKDISEATADEIERRDKERRDKERK